MITYKVSLCIGASNDDKPLVIKCHDTGFNLRVSLLIRRIGTWQDELERYSIPAGATAVLKITKPDNTYCTSDGVVESNKIFFAVPPQAFTVAGVDEAEVSIYGTDGRRVTSATFCIEVPQECICEGAEQSEDYIDIVGQQIARAGDAAGRAEAAAKEAEGYSTHPPIVGDNGNWLEWDGTAYVDTGKPSQGEPGEPGEPGKDGAPGAAGRGIESISYDRDKGVWIVRYTDRTYQSFSGIDPLTGKFAYFNDNFLDYPYTSADGLIEKYSDFRYYGNIKTARFTGASLKMTAIGSSKNTSDSVGVYYSGKPVMGEVVIEFDFMPTEQGGKNTPFIEVRLFNSAIWCRINRAGLNWWCVSTSSGLDIPSTPVAKRLSFKYELRTKYRIKITVKEGELAVKSWKASEDEPLTDAPNTIYLDSRLIDKNLLAIEYEPLFVFGQINDISNPNAQFACEIDNYTAYKLSR